MILTVLIGCWYNPFLSMFTRHLINLKSLDRDIPGEVKLAAADLKAEVLLAIDNQLRDRKDFIASTIRAETGRLEKGQELLEQLLETSTNVTSSVQRDVTCDDEVHVVRSHMDRNRALAGIKKCLEDDVVLKDELQIKVLPNYIWNDVKTFCDIRVTRNVSDL